MLAAKRNSVRLSPSARERVHRDEYGLTPKGTYSSALSPEGDTLYITWNVGRGGRTWDCCGLTVIHIPESERKP